MHTWSTVCTVRRLTRDSHQSTALDPDMQRLFTQHSRAWKEFDYVYPVISRRSKGLSIGINLSIDKHCNFNCTYCCVDRLEPPPRHDVDIDQLHDELDRMLTRVTSGRIWEDEPFSGTVPEYRRLNDVAFSGNGEPTACPCFGRAVESAVALKEAHCLSEIKIVVMTNASHFDRLMVARAFEVLDRHNGEIWAKLDAGNERWYRQVNRSDTPFGRILHNILACGRKRPIVIQSLFARWRGRPIGPADFDAYLDRLVELRRKGCQIKYVQLCTIARRVPGPTALHVAALSDPQLDRLVVRLRHRLPDLPVEVCGGVGGS